MSTTHRSCGPKLQSLYELDIRHRARSVPPSMALKCFNILRPRGKVGGGSRSFPALVVLALHGGGPAGDHKKRTASCRFGAVQQQRVRDLVAHTADVQLASRAQLSAACALRHGPAATRHLEQWAIRMRARGRAVSFDARRASRMFSPARKKRGRR